MLIPTGTQAAIAIGMPPERPSDETRLVKKYIRKPVIILPVINNPVLPCLECFSEKSAAINTIDA